MPRVWFRIKSDSRAGFSPVEVLLAATIFGFLVTALIGAIIYGQSATSDAGERVRAQALADEGVEAVRNMRDAAFSNVTNGTFGLAQSGGVWTLSGSSDTTGIFTRQVTITTVDSTRKTVSVTVTWPQGATTAQTGVATRLTDWLASIVAPITGGPIMMAYSKTTTVPSYRTWDGTAWSAEASAQAVVGNINYVVLKSSSTRDEAILGTQTSTGAIYIQIWNGTSWGNLTQVGTGPTTTRSFDIAYEKATGRALIAFTPSSGSADFAYRTWNGTTLSAATTITAPPTTGALNWLELRQNPLAASNEVAMIMLDANSDVYGMAWTGSTWSNMGTAAVWDATAASAAKKTIDVEYEQTSGEALFMWGDSVSTDQYYRTWNGTTLGAATLLDISTAGGLSEWVQLAGRPNSNEILLGVQDAGADLNTRKWSGTAWDTGTQHPEHSAAVENTTSRTFDVVWETAPANLGKAWIVWGDGATISTKVWSGTAWGTAAILSGSDDTSFIRLRADPTSGTLFAGIYESTTSTKDDIAETHLTDGGSVWSPEFTVWGGPVGATPAFFRIDIATP
jgi:Tfp pilus assembly protein PilV